MWLMIAVLWAVSSPVVGTGLALAVNAASDVRGEGPLGVDTLREHPFRWVAALTIASVVLAVLGVWWQRRLELQDDATEPPAVPPAPTVSVGTASDGGVVVGQISGPTVLIGKVENYTASAAGTVPAAVAGPPVKVNLPPRNPDFTGRVKLLAGLEAGLVSGPVAVVAVHGLGGVGKSQLALEFAHRGVESGRYEVAWWVRAESPVTLVEDLAAMAPGLGVPVTASQDETVAAVRAVLRGRDRWLVVFDNAPDVAAVRGWLPSGGGDVVITSRSRQWGGMARRLPVEVFARAESVQFLHDRTGESGPQLDELAGMLGDLPLALGQVAGFMERGDGLSVAGYLALYRDREAAGRLLASGVGDGYPHTVATTWLMHFEWLAEHAPAGLELLRLCAFLDPDEINVTLLLSDPELIDAELMPALARVAGSAVGRVEAASVLMSSSLIERVDDDRVRLHRLVAAVTRRQLTDTGEFEAWSRWCVGLLAGLMPVDLGKPQAWPTCAELAAHILVSSDHAEDTADTAVVLVRLGQYLHQRAEYKSAYALYQRALAIDERVYGTEHPEVAITLTNLGLVEQRLGELEQARVTLQRALAIQERVYGTEHPEVAITLTNLGLVEQRLSELEQAQVTLQQALDIKERLYGPEHPEVAVTLANLGVVKRRLGELKQAQVTLQRALEIEERVYGPEHPRIAVTLGNLGIVERRLGELKQAQVTLQRALAIQERVYGTEHPEVAVTLNSLGIVEQQLGELEQAQVTLQRALAIKERVYGPEHPEVAVTLTNLGIVEQQLGELEQAQVTLQRALAIQERVYGTEHPEVAVTLNSLGIVEQQLGELEQAQVTLQRALAIDERVYGPEHPEVAVTLTNLGIVEQQLGELEQAHVTLQRALDIDERVYGPEHPEVAVTLTSLGIVEQRLGELEQARVTLERAYRTFQQRLGGLTPTHPARQRPTGGHGHQRLSANTHRPACDARSP